MRGAQRGQPNSLGVHSSCNCVTTLTWLCTKEDLSFGSLKTRALDALAPWRLGGREPSRRAICENEHERENARRRATCGNGNCGGLLGLPRSTEAAEAAIRTAPELPSMS